MWRWWWCRGIWQQQWRRMASFKPSSAFFFSLNLSVLLIFILFPYFCSSISSSSSPSCSQYAFLTTFFFSFLIPILFFSLPFLIHLTLALSYPSPPVALSYPYFLLVLLVCLLPSPDLPLPPSFLPSYVPCCFFSPALLLILSPLSPPQQSPSMALILHLPASRHVIP